MELEGGLRLRRIDGEPVLERPRQPFRRTGWQPDSAPSREADAAPPAAPAPGKLREKPRGKPAVAPTTAKSAGPGPAKKPYKSAGPARPGKPGPSGGPAKHKGKPRPPRGA